MLNKIVIIMASVALASGALVSMSPTRTLSQALFKGGSYWCIDWRFHCQPGQTCCNTAGEDQDFMCCHYDNGVCCDGGKTCCPHGYVCGKEGNKCFKDKEVEAEQLPLIPEGLEIDDMAKELGDSSTCVLYSQFKCPTNTTCCANDSDPKHITYGCCGLPDATCCLDNKHCCPKGSLCNSDSCDFGSEKQDLVPINYPMTLGQEVSTPSVIINGEYHSLDWVKKDVQECPDHVTKCSVDATCCPIGSNKFACCPTPNGVCCQNGKTCCKEGYECVDGGTSCRPKEAVTMEETSPVTDVLCPDRQYKCPSGYSCCKMATGEYGCCPLIDAVCCKDGQHCCPHGTQCDEEGKTCRKSIKLHAALKHLFASDPTYHKAHKMIMGMDTSKSDKWLRFYYALFKHMKQHE